MLVDDDGTRYIEAATFDEEYGVYEEPEQFGNFIRYVMETPNFPTGPQF